MECANVFIVQVGAAVVIVFPVSFMLPVVELDFDPETEVYLDALKDWIDAVSEADTNS